MRVVSECIGRKYSSKVSKTGLQMFPFHPKIKRLKRATEEDLKSKKKERIKKKVGKE
jgi:hypothetical protein